MKVLQTELPDILIIEPKVFGDNRGFFFESYNQQEFREMTGLTVDFVQDNHSRSLKNVLRGLHYQIRQPQGKLVRVIKGEAFDVAVDIRRSSPSFGKWVGIHLSAENKKQLWIPPGFAHGFAVVSEMTEFVYKATDYYAPKFERCIHWKDPQIGIDWPLDEHPLVSAKDENGVLLKDAEVFA